jgi:hypothetical protein
MKAVVMAAHVVELAHDPKEILWLTARVADVL